MKKLLCAALAAVMVCVSVTGCGKKEEASENSGKNMVEDFGNGDNIDIDAEDMPYGANIVELRPEYDENVKYIIGYDKRYFGGDEDNQDLTEIYKLHDYILAVNTKDAELFKSLFYPGYLEYISEKNNYESVDKYVELLFQSIENTLGKGFEINYIDVSNCQQEGDKTADVYFGMTDDVLSVLDSEYYNKVTSRKLVEIGGCTCFAGEDGTYLLTNYSEPFALSLYEIDGKAYIFC